MGAVRDARWLGVAGVLVVLLGAKKLPDMARSIGQSARVFKGEMKGMKADEVRAENSQEQARKYRYSM